MTRPGWAEAIAKRRLIELRASQESIAALAGGHLTQSDVSRIERGQLHPHELTVLKFFGLLKALGWSLEDFSDATGLTPGLDEALVSQLEAIEATRHLQVRPEYVQFPVYDASTAGMADAKPNEGGVAFISRSKLAEKGIDPQHFRVFRVDENCLISTEARVPDKGVAFGDHIGVDTRRRARVGDVVVAWWEAEKKLVVKRHGIERENVGLYPLAPGESSRLLPTDQDLKVLGCLTWRAG